MAHEACLQVEGEPCTQCGEAVAVRHIWTFGAYVECPACLATDYSETGGPSFPTPADLLPHSGGKQSED